MADDAYPAWLWELNFHTKKTKYEPEEQISLNYLRFSSKEKIKANSLAKKNK